MAWNLNSDRPIFIQIVERIEMDIISGKYKPGDKLPSVRDLAAEAAVRLFQNLNEPVLFSHNGQQDALLRRTLP